MKSFVAGALAWTEADLVGIHRNTAVRFLHKLREEISSKQQNRSKQFCEKIKLDESYFGGTQNAQRKTEVRSCLKSASFLVC